MSDLIIRTATRDDVSLILGFITELAIYEKAEHEVLATPALIEESIFGEGATAKALIVERGEKALGFAIYFYNYSTWLGRKGLFLEDLYISPDARGSGAGKAMLKHLAQIAVAEGCGRFEWNVIDWNEPAIQFYESFGAEAQKEWVGYRLSGQTLADFAQS
jgi:GNAT superfamily N-acetyltransferase